MLPTDRPKWSDREGKTSRPKDSFFLWNFWEWEGDWQLCGGDEKDHWEYAVDFQCKYSPREGRLDLVRRRCWQRKMKYSPQ